MASRDSGFPSPPKTQDLQGAPKPKTFRSACKAQGRQALPKLGVFKARPKPKAVGAAYGAGSPGLPETSVLHAPPANRVSKTPTSSRSTSCPKKLEVEWSGSVWLLAHVISLTCLTRAALVIDQAQPTHTMRSTLRGARWRRSVYQGAGRK